MILKQNFNLIVDKLSPVSNMASSILDTDKSLSTIKLKFCFWESHLVYIKSNRMRNIHAKKNIVLLDIITIVVLHSVPTSVPAMQWLCLLCFWCVKLYGSHSLPHSSTYPPPWLFTRNRNVNIMNASDFHKWFNDYYNIVSFDNFWVIAPNITFNYKRNWLNSLCTTSPVRP